MPPIPNALGTWPCSSLFKKWSLISLLLNWADLRDSLLMKRTQCNLTGVRERFTASAMVSWTTHSPGPPFAAPPLQTKPPHWDSLSHLERLVVLVRVLTAQAPNIWVKGPLADSSTQPIKPLLANGASPAEAPDAMEKRHTPQSQFLTHRTQERNKIVLVLCHHVWAVCT